MDVARDARFGHVATQSGCRKYRAASVRSFSPSPRLPNQDRHRARRSARGFPANGVAVPGLASRNPTVTGSSQVKTVTRLQRDRYAHSNIVTFVTLLTSSRLS